jgi:hypothetical protein
MKSKYSFMPLKEVKALLPAMQMYGVSKVARSPGYVYSIRQTFAYVLDEASRKFYSSPL